MKSGMSKLLSNFLSKNNTFCLIYEKICLSNEVLVHFRVTKIYVKFSPALIVWQEIEAFWNFYDSE